MDTVTHILAGSVIAVPAGRRYGRPGAVAVIAGTVMPDSDTVLRFFGPDTYLEYHRVFFNSLPGAALLSIAVALLLWREGKDRDFWKLYALTAVAVFLHVFMDLTNSYGEKLLWPFSDRWFALDAVFIVDPWIAGVLVVSLVSMKFTGRKAAVAAACFVLISSYWGLRLYTHHAALSHFRAENPDAVRVGAFPRPVNPFAWEMVAETQERFDLGIYNLATGVWGDQRTYLKMPETPAVEKARETRTARIFLGFARFPWISYERSPEGTKVYFQDLRYAPPSQGERRFVTTVFVGKDGSVREGSFKF